MGMYTEIYINCDLKNDTPDDVIETLKAICEGNYESIHLQNKPSRWSTMFNGSAYFTDTTVAELRYNNEAWHWNPYYTLHGKGAIKNYENEIGEFFEWIKPWVVQDFIGYTHYEEDREPTLVYSGNIDNE